MQRVLMVLVVLGLIFAVGGLALADQNPAGSVNFKVKWTVEPFIMFDVHSGDDWVLHDNGIVIGGDPNFADFVFESRNPYIDNAGNVYGPNDIWAFVASNDNWRIEFIKPSLVSDNDHYTTVPVHAERTKTNFYTENQSTRGDFTGNDLINGDLGLYSINWRLWVEFEDWYTRSGNYENTYYLICTQL